jgi:hypothetical protein
LILLADPLINDGHFMEWTIVRRLFVKQVTWGGAIALGYNLLRGAHPAHQRQKGDRASISADCVQNQKL